jgi:hypothetical protein
LLPLENVLGAQQRRALSSLAGIPFGATDATMSINGFTRQTLMRLIRATTKRKIKAGGQTVGRIRIAEVRRPRAKVTERRL